MKQFATVAPGAIWAALIAFTVLLAEYLQAQFGLVEWMPILVGFLTAVLVPFFRWLAERDPALAAYGEVGAPSRSKLSRWLL